MNTMDRHGSDDLAQASAIALLRTKTARQRRHGIGFPATGRAAALKRLRWAWVSVAGEPGEVSFRPSDLS